MPFCTSCGTRNPDDARFCSQCGAPLVDAAPTPGDVGDESTATISIGMDKVETSDRQLNPVDEAAVDALPAGPEQCRSVVISGAGDRRDDDIRAQTAILGAAFDEVLLYQDAAQRGRADGEVMRLLREGLGGAKRTKQVDEIRGEFLAIDTALGRLEPGDLCLVLVDQVEEALEHLRKHVAGQ